jgi:hypothetical protein
VVLEPSQDQQSVREGGVGDDESAFAWLQLQPGLKLHHAKDLAKHKAEALRLRKVLNGDVPNRMRAEFEALLKSHSEQAGLRRCAPRGPVPDVALPGHGDGSRGSPGDAPCHSAPASDV